SAKLDPGLVATTGTFVGRFNGTNSTTATRTAFSSDLFRVEASTGYVFSAYTATKNLGAGVKQQILFYSDLGTTSVGTFTGPGYFTNTFPNWSVSSFTFSTPAGARFARMVLASVPAAQGGTLY